MIFQVTWLLTFPVFLFSSDVVDAVTTYFVLDGFIQWLGSLWSIRCYWTSTAISPSHSQWRGIMKAVVQQHLDGHKLPTASLQH